MLKPTKNQILRKVLSHLHRDIKEQKRGVSEDEELAGEVDQKKSRKELKNHLLKKGMITKDQLRRGKKKK